jgi:hypothetical protein
MARQRFRQRPDQAVTAIQLTLDMDGLRYRKWGHDQVAKPGDWLVDNQGDVYTVAAATFARTYRAAGRGYVKTTPVWAEQATSPGSVATQEGHTDYAAGDWLVSNQEDGGDGYAIKDEKFRALYELDDAR